MPPIVYGYRPFLGYVIELLWCSWRGHQFKKDFKSNDRCQACLYCEKD